MTPTPEEIVKEYYDDPALVVRVAHRAIPSKMEIVEPNPAWPQTFATLKALIVEALGATAIVVEHTGSTSVPGLPAKDVIDIDLIVPDPTDEAAYVARLEAAGFHFLLREPAWHQHRFFCRYEPLANLHVFGPDAVEPVRHRIFRDWLRSHPDDKELYAEIKRGAMRESSQSGEDMMQYTGRKDAVVRGILQKAFRSLGYID
ncbi:grpb/dephospho-CoA kinase [Talaromyces proteolyticus]|uniref:Grpb/dephospho-CoA kinase n=1 Tax=Talaromyces proteolyticus TaxID=1131652 RepID=A0AAD4KJE4_9EURO|nr:grpb/dephospho-CoA kinase [Talaromyces proteolyticus]KAH8689896.1 grpb/dephospho-CoA kinase [Talaromyces proteolyticus]